MTACTTCAHSADAETPLSSELPKVVVLATGGTIVSSGASATQMTGYSITNFTVEMLTNAVPALKDIAQVECRQVANIDSSSMTSAVWFDLARAVEEAAAREDVAGIVITHGTDTMEETAMFLNLVVKTGKPVVMTGAMRPSTAISAEGPLNLLNAVRIALDPDAANRGVLVALNDTILGARDATKVQQTNAAAFGAPNAGALGMISGPRIVWVGKPEHPHTRATGFDVSRFAGLTKLPRVDIVYSHADDDGVMVEAAVAAGARAIVHAGTGNGSIHAATEGALLEAARKGVIVIRASRVPGGATVEGLTEWQAAGFVPAGDLNPQKARVLAQVVLADPRATIEDVKAAFLTY